MTCNPKEETTLSNLCDPRALIDHSLSRREFMKRLAAAGSVATGVSMFEVQSSAAQGTQPRPGTAASGERYLIRGGAVLSMDPAVGDFAEADVLVEGNKIAAVGRNIN